jgi:Protein of unknown function (DUF3108)
MKFRILVCIFAICAVSVSAETLHYSINWQSGLSLGEAAFASEHSQSVDKGPEQWRFALDIDAGIPGFAVHDNYHSSALGDVCSVQLDKSSTHGKKKGEEKVTFDQQQNTITRETPGAGKSDTSVSSCARDALSFLQFVRRELAQGRIAPDQAVVFGAVYRVHIDFKGAQTIKVGDKMVETDRTMATIKGPATDLTVEIFFARDQARTPVLARVPLALGTFSVELQP